MAETTSERSVVIRSPRSLSLAQLLLATLIAALAISQWLSWRSGERPFEDVLSLSCLAGWLVGSLFGQAFLGHGVLGATSVCAIAAGVVSTRFELAFQPMAVVIGIAALLACMGASAVFYGPQFFAWARQSLLPRLLKRAQATASLLAAVGAILLTTAALALRERPPEPQRFSSWIGRKDLADRVFHFDLAMSAKGEYLAAWSPSDSRVHVLNTRSREIRRIKSAPGIYALIDVSPSGQSFLVNCDSGLSLMDTFGRLRRLNFTPKVSNLHFRSETVIANDFWQEAWSLDDEPPRQIAFDESSICRAIRRNWLSRQMQQAMKASLGSDGSACYETQYGFLGESFVLVDDGRSLICCECEPILDPKPLEPSWLAELPFLPQRPRRYVRLIVIGIQPPHRVTRSAAVEMEVLRVAYDERFLSPLLTKDGKTVVVADSELNVAMWSVEDLVRNR